MDVNTLRSTQSTLRLLRPESWERLRGTIAAWPRTRVIESDASHLRAECRSRLCGFVDDLTVDRIIDDAIARSSARVGLYNFGVNARRLARMREQLRGYVE